ncbi:hypothetical protein [Halogeometricum limi]|uniref:Uncharacterized protein n=1 Tax=Halogeometricum limi TaxID=555875 RepID=A0A1I6FQ19_9EURY|nr:hypothetical protein [Halogeometricum limi]SFR32040.1 hypothetical protein SAMN04488124_0049 [Halogeometricum limi]
MRPRNRHGEPVDPVPFLVVSGVALLLCVSFGPLYCAAFGLDFSVGVPLSLAVAAGVAVVSYHRYVWTTDPELRGEVPVDARFRRLLYGGLVLALVFALLSIPLL